MQTISSNFIGNFKTGDNINHNLRVLEVLYKLYEESNDHEKRLLCKLIILIIVSVIEAAFHDFYMRVNIFTIEGVANLTSNIIEYIRSKQIDELDKYIKNARKHNLMDVKNMRFYDFLDDLRKLRNRIHIQNTKNNFEADEYQAFTKERKLLAEVLCERILSVMASKHSRGSGYGHVADFVLPWNQHTQSEIQNIVSEHIIKKRELDAQKIDF